MKSMLSFIHCRKFSFGRLKIFPKNNALISLFLMVCFTTALHAQIPTPDASFGIGTALNETIDAVKAVVQPIYVNASASGSNDGTSWTNAFTSLQSALDAAVSGDEIWVARGTYKPSSPYSLTNSPRYYHFELINDVTLYGGFEGTEEPGYFDPDDRDFQANETILSGDLSGNDVFDAASEGYQYGTGDDNCYNVFYHTNTLGLTSSAVLDGFTITGGNTGGFGAGMYNYSCVPTLGNVIFRNNSGGGALFFFNSTGAQSSNLTFDSNFGNSYGGLFLFGTTTITLTNALFINNYGGRGAAIHNYNANSTITNATFYGNHASAEGGAIYNIQGLYGITLNNCIMWGNSAGSEGNEIYNKIGYVTLNYSCYSNQTNDVSGTVTINSGNITSDPQFADAENSDLRLTGVSPCVDAGYNDYNSETYDIRNAEYFRAVNKTTGLPGTIDMGAYEYMVGTDPEGELSVRVAAKVLLQGSWDATGDTLTTSLQGTIPLTAPYSRDPRSIASIPEGITDWVLVELRTVADGSAIASRSAFLRKDGTIVAEDGITEYIEMIAATGSYYLVLHHRNHLAVMSAVAQTLNTSSATLYDFTTGSDKYYGTGGAVELETNIWGMYSGDNDNNNAIETVDYAAWQSSAKAGSSGYQNTDLNLDGQVTTADYVLWFNSQLAGAASQVP